MRTIVFVIIFFSCQAQAQNPWKDVYKETTWAQRDAWQRAEEIIKHLNIKPGDRVADIGSHEGYFTVKLAETVGQEGRVYAVDISRNKIEKLKENLAARKINNVVAIVGDADNPKLPTGALDAVLIVDTYHEINAHQEMLHYISMSLKPGGKLVLCEPVSDGTINKTRAEQEKKHELGLNYALDDLKKAGFHITFSHADYIDRLQEKADTMWILVAEKP